jgi:DNA-binding LacI/PurR family transcriptional regulator
VPEDIRIVGFDDASIGRQCTPQLTSMTNPAAEHARIAAEMLMEILAGGVPEVRNIMTASQLVVRGST